MNLDIESIKKLPIRVRHWFIKRLIKKQEKVRQSDNHTKPTSKEKPVSEIDMNKVDKFFAKFGE